MGGQLTGELAEECVFERECLSMLVAKCIKCIWKVPCMKVVCILALFL